MARVGDSILDGTHGRISFATGVQACKWAAITSVVIAQPVIGKLSQVAVERVLGTVLGGIFGFGAFRRARRAASRMARLHNFPEILQCCAETTACRGDAAQRLWDSTTAS